MARQYSLTETLQKQLSQNGSDSKTTKALQQSESGIPKGTKKVKVNSYKSTFHEVLLKVK